MCRVTVRASRVRMNIFFQHDYAYRTATTPTNTKNTLV